MQTQHEIAPHLETLTRALGNKVGTEIDPEELKAEFLKYLEYGIPVQEAQRTILRHHKVPLPPELAPATPDQSAMSGGGPSPPSGIVPLADLPSNAPAINVKARLLGIGSKTVNARGEEKEIFVGQLGDESGSIWYTSWRPLEGLERGDVIEVHGAYTKTFRDEVQLNFGDRTKIQKLPSDALPPFQREYEDKQIADLREGDRDFRVSGRILNVDTREVTVKGEPKVIYGGNLADESGKIEFTVWDDVGLEEGKAVTIEGAYIRAYQGAPQLNFDATANIAPFEGDLPDAETLDQTLMTPIATLIDQGGAQDIQVAGTILEVRAGSGLVFRDPDSNRVIPKGTKTEDGRDGIPDLRVKGILDDGTGPVNFVVGKEATQEILGKDVEQCLAEARESMDFETHQDELQEKLAGRQFKIRGFARSDEWGLMLIGRTMQPYRVDAGAGAQELLESLPDLPAIPADGAYGGTDVADATGDETTGDAPDDATPEATGAADSDDGTETADEAATDDAAGEADLETEEMA